MNCWIATIETCFPCWHWIHFLNQSNEFLKRGQNCPQITIFDLQNTGQCYGQVQVQVTQFGTYRGSPHSSHYQNDMVRQAGLSSITRQGPRISIRIDIWILPSDNYLIYLLMKPRMFHLQKSQQWCWIKSKSQSAAIRNWTVLYIWQTVQVNL